MALMKFYKGSEANAQYYLDGIYLATDTHKLFYKGSPYGRDSYVELDWVQDFKEGSGTMEEAAFEKLKDAVDNYKLLVVNYTAAHSTRVCTPEIGDDGSYICKFTDINNYENAEEYILAVKIASVNPSTRAITMLHDTTYPLGGKDIDLSNYYTIAQVDDKIGTNVYTGANYISKETNLTEAVLQLDEEIKATNDNLTLEHINTEATYAKKADLSDYLPLTGGKITGDLAINMNSDGVNDGVAYIGLFRGINGVWRCYLINYPDAPVGYLTRGFEVTGGLFGVQLGLIRGDYDSTPKLILDMSYAKLEMDINGITISNKSSSDLLNAGGGTTSVSDIITQVQAAIVDSAPETLNTLNELAAALGDDPNFATTVTELIATKQDLLVSGTNIKTVAGESLLGSGNIAIEPNDITLDLSGTHYLTDLTNIEDSLKTLDNLIYEIAQAITLKQY